MQTITASVGENGKNTISDVALVQAILLKMPRVATPANPATQYLSAYDGVCGATTKAAIRAFQTDHVFVSPQSAANPNATAGLVKPGDATWKTLLEKVNSDCSDMRVLEGGKTVYVAATTAQLQAKIAAANVLTFAPAFRTKVIACLNRMLALHGIAVGVCPNGARRTFQGQYDLLTNGRGVTRAGPGESNHDFGMAVDLGFAGLRWLKSDGAVTENETPWLQRLDPNPRAMNPQALLFWETLRSVGTSPVVGAFRGPVADRPHLQNWSDTGVSMTARLADLLARSGTMRWSVARSVYSSDLGFGGALFPLGTAAQIWNREAAVTIDTLARARAPPTAHPGEQDPGIAPHQPGTPGRTAGTAVAHPTQADVVAMRQELRRQFELADANWQNWTPR